PELKAANLNSKEFTAKAGVLRELVEHHIREEEKEMFPEARRLMGESQLRAIGDEVAARKETLMAMWTNPVLKPVKKLQSAAHKLMPTKVKNAKASAIAAMRDTDRGE